MKPENLNQWSGLQLETEVCSILEDPRYLIMQRMERVDNSLPATRTEMIDFIFLHRRGLYRKD